MMDSLKAFYMGEAARAAGNKPRQLDWEKAREICEQHKGDVIYAGLKDDMEWTAGLIYDGEKRVKEYVYVASVWATPVLEIDGKEVECWKYGDDPDMPAWWTEGDAS